MENQQKNKNKTVFNDNNLLIDPNPSVSSDHLKKIQRKHLVIEIVLGILAIAVLAAMILVITLI